jgi:hypothetical protein
LNVIPKMMFGNFQSSGSNDWIPNVTYDNRWPITGHDTAVNVAASMTHTRGSARSPPTPSRWDASATTAARRRMRGTHRTPGSSTPM